MILQIAYFSEFPFLDRGCHLDRIVHFTVKKKSDFIAKKSNNSVPRHDVHQRGWNRTFWRTSSNSYSQFLLCIPQTWHRTLPVHFL